MPDPTLRQQIEQAIRDEAAKAHLGGWWTETWTPRLTNAVMAMVEERDAERIQQIEALKTPDDGHLPYEGDVQNSVIEDVLRIMRGEAAQ